MHIVATVDNIDEYNAAADDGDGVDDDEYNAAGGDDGAGVDAFHLVTRTDTSLGLQVADQPLGVVHQLRLDSREIKKFPIHRIHRMFKRCYFQTSLKHDNF